MFGRLPRLHLVTLVAISIVAFLGAGLWLGTLTVVPFPVGVGAALGAVAGIVAAWAFVHDFHHRAHPARVVRRR